MQSKAGNIGIVARTRHCPMHGPDDVSPNPEIAQRILYPARTSSIRVRSAQRGRGAPAWRRGQLSVVSTRDRCLGRLPAIGASANQNMDMRIVGVPMIDGDPIKFRSQVAFDTHHQLPCEFTEVLHVGCVLGRNDEAEVMAIFRTSRGESTAVGRIGSGIEHASIGSVPGTIAPEVADVFGERCLTATPAPTDRQRNDRSVRDLNAHLAAAPTWQQRIVAAYVAHGEPLSCQFR